MSHPPDYGIIYNWDGAPHGYSPVPQSMDAFLGKTYAPLEDTQVGALFWCVGEHATRWPSDALELVGDLHQRRYENAASYTHAENIRRMLDRGEDPQQAVIDRGHELNLHVYASLRMNDNHFNGAQLADLQTLHHTELTQLRKDHPEWLLGEDTEEWFALSWNMAIPQVRENRFQHLREVCQNYPWDGVELDWQRHPFHFPADYAYRLRYIFTDFMRAARQLTDELAQERGQPFYLAARVAGSIEGCHRIGYDVETWVKENLVDILIPAGAAATDPAIEVSAFRALCADRDIALYPGFDGGVPGPAAGPEGETARHNMRTKATAMQYHQQDATGIYAFNWHADRDSKRELLTQVGAVQNSAPPRQALQRHPPLPPAHRGVARRVPARPAARHPTRPPLPNHAGDRPSLRPRPRRRLERRPTDDHYSASASARLGRWRRGSLLLGRRGLGRPGYHLLPRRRPSTYLRCQRRRLAQLRAHGRPSRPRPPSHRSRSLATPSPTCLRLAANRRRGINPL